MKTRIDARLVIILILVNAVLFSSILYLTFLTRDRMSNNSAPIFNNLSLPITEDVDKLRLTSKAFIIYDSQGRVIVAGKNEYFRFSPASTAKIMAATIALENYPLDRVFTASGLNTLGPDNSKMGLVEGEQMTVENLLYGMMLPSGNDAAYVIAKNFPGGSQAFVNAMNKKAKELNMDNTKFVDPDGYDDENYTNAFDLARLASYAMKNKEFAKIVGTRRFTVTDISGQNIHDLKNLNELLGTDGVNGVKTGFTNEAGGVLVTSIQDGDKNYIVVVLNSLDRFADTENIIRSLVKKITSISY